MTNITRTKFMSGTLVLPKDMRKRWNNREVILLTQNDRLIIQPVEAEWERYEARILRAKNRISPTTIAVAARRAKRRS